MSTASSYVFYSDGMIRGHGNMSSSEAVATAAMNGHEGALELPEGVAFDQVYIHQGGLRPRGKMSVAVDGLTITGIPNGASLTVHGVSTVIEGGTATLSFDEPGTHLITLSLPPRWLDFSLEVTS